MGCARLGVTQNDAEEVDTALVGGETRVLDQTAVGRQVPGGEAIAVLNLDSLPPDAAIAEVKKHPQVSSVSVVKLPPAGEMPAWFG